MAREIVLDTATTGLDHRTGDRLIELACVELEDYLPTGRTFHELMHPDRDIHPDAERVHGISLASLEGKPRFHHPQVSDAFLAFIGEDAALIAHNAAFDRGFINSELTRMGRPTLADARWIDTLQLAQKRFPGMSNSLDSLCKRFKISLADREKHGALIDSQLLAAVYLELRGGREKTFDLDPVAAAGAAFAATGPIAHGPRPRPLAPRSTEAERADHAAFVGGVLKDKAIWLKFGMELG